MKTFAKNPCGFIMIMSLLMLFSSCKGEKKTYGTETIQYGDAGSAALDIDDIFASPDSLAGSTIVIQGLCTHICSHGGTKIFLMGSDDTKVLRVEAGATLGSFPEKTVNSIVEVTGKLVEDRIDEDYLREWEAQIAELQTESDGSSDGTKSGCEADRKANNEDPYAGVSERISDFRVRIAERAAKEGKAYVSLYHLEADSFRIL